jgi:parallel beta-helix repeat protein
MASLHVAIVCLGVAAASPTHAATLDAGPIVFSDASNLPGFSAALAAAPPYRCVTNRYIDPVRGNDANPGTQSKPWRTIQNADNGYPNTPTPGQCINVLPGTYRLAKTLILGHGGNSNTSIGYVVYRSATPHAAHLVADNGIETGGNGDIVMLYAPYLLIDGFDVDGNKRLTRGHGIDGCAGGGAPIAIAHHFIATNNIVHDMGGAGLSSCSADYITWRNNEVYGTSATNQYQASGISVWKPKASHAATPEHAPFNITIAFNIIHDNMEGPSIVGTHTDGNGIIIDTTLNSADCPTCATPYPGRVLVLGNVAYNNGGGGIHVFLSRGVVVANNTVFNNYLDKQNPATPRGELSNVGSDDTLWINNIAIAHPGEGVLAYNQAITTLPMPGGFQDNAIWTRNLTFGGEVTSDARSVVDRATNLLGVDPKLSDPEAARFTPTSASPALRAGLPAAYLPWAHPNIGAY